MPDEQPKRTTDQRIDAIAESVELLASMQQENERAIGRLTARLADVGQFINQLPHIAEAHEHRLDRLEDQP